MGIFEELGGALSLIMDTFCKKWWKILTLSFLADTLILPSIQWSILALKYMIVQNSSSLNSFAQATVSNILPWWIDIFVNPIGVIIEFLFIVLIVTAIFSLIENDS